MEIDLPIIVMNSDLEPARAHDDDAGLDLRSDTGCALHPGEQVTVGTGVKMMVPKGYVALAASRSGHGKNMNVTLANSVGVIDSGYQGEIRATLTNNGNEVKYIDKFERICQVIIVPIPKVNIKPVKSFDEVTDRGERGFGSSGKLDVPEPPSPPETRKITSNLIL